MTALAHSAQLSAAGLRVALFSGNYNCVRDGANQALNRLAEHLESQGASVRVYAPTVPRPAFASAAALVSAPSFPIPGRPEYRLTLGLSPGLRRDLAAFAPNVIHLSAPDPLGFQAAAWARRHGVPVVASLHTRFETYPAYYGLKVLEPAVRTILRAFYRRADRILAPNAPMAELLRADGLGDRLRLWGRGVDRQQFSPARRDMAWRRSQGIGDDDTAVLFFGRLVHEKGLEPFATTLEALDRPDIRPVVVGDGPAGTWLRQRLPTAVFTGHLQGAALGRAVASADILLNPSRTEAFGNVTLEAMACGLCVVCPDAPSTRRLVRDGTDGVLTPSPTPAAYAEAIARLAGDKALRERMGAAARRSSAGYSWFAAGAAVVDVYREVTAPGFTA